MRVGSPFASFPRSRVVQGLGQSPGGQARTAPPPGSAVNSPSPCRPALRGLGCDLGYERGVHLPQGPLLGVDGSREEGVPELRPSHKRERRIISKSGAQVPGNSDSESHFQRGPTCHCLNPNQACGSSQVSFLVLMLYFSDARCYRGGSGRRPSRHYFCNFLWTYNYFRVKSFLKCHCLRSQRTVAPCCLSPCAHSPAADFYGGTARQFRGCACLFQRP